MQVTARIAEDEPIASDESAEHVYAFEKVSSIGHKIESPDEKGTNMRTLSKRSRKCDCARINSVQ